MRYLLLTATCLVSTMPAQAAELYKVASHVVKSTITGWDGDVAFSASFASGNTEKEEVKGELQLNKEAPAKEWGHTIKASAHSSKENDQQSEEEYRILGQSRFNLSEKDFAFGELEYINDRFGGYQYRISEGVGYGRRFYNNETFKLVGEVSLGARQEKDTSDKTSNNVSSKLSTKAHWHINDNLELHEDLSVVFSDGTLTRSETSLRNDMTDSLYLKVSFVYEHNSDVPDDKESTDTLTSVGVGYRF